MTQNNKEYWLNRAIINDKKMQKDLKKLEKQLKKKFVEASKEIKKELAYFYAQKSNLTEYEKYRLESTLKAIYSILDTLYHKEEEMLNNRLIEAYIDTYKDVSRELAIESAFTMINEDLIREVVKTNWSGLTFSERIWENRRRLALTIKQELNAGLIRGDSLQDMANTISNKLNSSYKDALRLAHTETCWVQNQATINSYKDNEVKEYEFSAFLDSRTSEVCKSLDGKIIKVEEALPGTNLPPLHPYCRSCILPIVD